MGIEGERTCRLCRSPLGEARGDAADGGFCCAGCARVFDVLDGIDPDAGEAYLRAARALGIVPSHSSSASTVHGPEPGAPLALAPPPTVDPAAVREERFLAEGIVCPSCTFVIEEVLRAQAGVLEARFDFCSGAGTVRLDLRRTSPDRLREALAPFGYRLRRAEDGASKGFARGVTFAFVASAVLTMNLMSLSVLRYARDLHWLEVLPSFLPWIELVLCLPVLALGWLPTARRALQSLRHRLLTMDFLVALSILAAFLLSIASLVLGREDIYFETAAGLTTVSLLSRMVEARLRERALRDTAALMRLGVARVRLDGIGAAAPVRERYRLLEEVGPGDRLLFLAGELVPLDGQVAEGEAHLGEAVITGEPTPVHKRPGDHVVAGSIVALGELHLCALRRHCETQLFRIAQALRESLSLGEGRLRSADAAATVFGPLVLVLAFAAWLCRLALYGWTFALGAEGWFPSVAVLAVACPCAFSIAGVAAVTAATGALLRRGLLVRDPAKLEPLHRVGTVLFDKTGTLTEGKMRVEELAWRDGPRPELLGPLLVAEAHALHPIAQTLRRHVQALAPAVTLPVAAGDEAVDLPGEGRRLSTGGRAFLVGAASLFRSPFFPPGTAPQHTLVWFGWDGEAEGCFLLSDGVRAGAREAVAGLHALGLRVELLSGDRQEVCDYVARSVGADGALGSATLEAKVDLVRARAARGERIALVGDGTNDALAMREAEVGIALDGATDEALAASSIVLLRPHLPALVELFQVAHRLSRVIRGNHLFAFGFNGLFLPIAALGLLSPLASMLLMLVSSSGVLLNSLRLRTASRP